MPQQIIEKRQDLDDMIKFQVALQLIRAVCSGGIVRRQRNLAKKEANKRLRRAQQIVLGGGDLKNRVSVANQSKVRRAKIAPTQDENALGSNLWIYSENPDTGPLRLLCCKIAEYELAKGSQLASIAEDSGFAVGPHGIFEVEEPELEICLKESQDFRDLVSHVNVIEEFKTVLQEVAGLAAAYLQLAAKSYGIDIGEHFENIAKVPPSDLTKLLNDPYVVTILPMHIKKQRRMEMQMATTEVAALVEDVDESVHDLQLRKQHEIEQKRREVDEKLKEEEIQIKLHLVELQDEYCQHEAKGNEMMTIIEYSQKRVATMALDLEAKRFELQRQAAAAARSADKSRSRARPTSTTILQQVAESSSKVMHILSQGEDESDDAQDRWWQAPDAGLAHGESDSLHLQIDMDQVQHVHILPDLGDLCGDAAATKFTSKPAPYDSSVASSSFRPNTAPIMSCPAETMSLPGQQDNSWCAQDLSSTAYNDSDGQDQVQTLVTAINDSHTAQATQQNEHASTRPFTAPQNMIAEKEAEKLQESLQITQAEILRLERAYRAGLRANAKQKQNRLSVVKNSSEEHEASELARARRDKKKVMQDQVDSASGTSGLLSPRDKPTRKEMMRRELEKKKRAAEDRANGFFFCFVLSLR